MIKFYSYSTASQTDGQTDGQADDMIMPIADQVKSSQVVFLVLCRPISTIGKTDGRPICRTLNVKLWLSKMRRSFMMLNLDHCSWWTCSC